MGSPPVSVRWRHAGSTADAELARARRTDEPPWSSIDLGEHCCEHAIHWLHWPRRFDSQRRDLAPSQTQRFLNQPMKAAFVETMIESQEEGGEEYASHHEGSTSSETRTESGTLWLENGESIEGAGERVFAVCPNTKDPCYPKHGKGGKRNEGGTGSTCRSGGARNKKGECEKGKEGKSNGGAEVCGALGGVAGAGIGTAVGGVGGGLVGAAVGGEAGSAACG